MGVIIFDMDAETVDVEPQEEDVFVIHEPLPLDLDMEIVPVAEILPPRKK